MTDTLPVDIPGLDINGVIYNYVINKETGAQVGVEVRNKYAEGEGYIFRERDEWMPGSLSGTEINKVVPVVPTNRALWGDGEIAVDGNGSVSEANVVYTYRVDPCYDPQFDPNCAGYKPMIPDIPEVDLTGLYDATDRDSEIVQYRNKELYENEEAASEEELAEKEAEEEKDSKERLEKALAAADNTALFAEALAMSQMMNTMALAVNINSYTSKQIGGGVYKETTTLQDKQIPDNRKGLRNGLAQQLVHEQMVKAQYD